VRRPTAVRRPAPIVTDPGGTRRLRVRDVPSPPDASTPIDPDAWNDAATLRGEPLVATLPELPSVADVDEAETEARPLGESGDRAAPRPSPRLSPRPAVSSNLPWILLGVAALIASLAGCLVVTLTQLTIGTPDSPPPIAEQPREPAPSILQVISEPAGASVLVDGHPAQGTTPLSLSLPAEQRQVWLRLSLPGHLDQERQVSTGAGEARFVLSPISGQ
jgi:hypothetical protein